jgi:hypothetical protein
MVRDWSSVSESESPEGFPPGVEIEELSGHLLDGLLGPLFRFLPGSGSELVKRRQSRPNLGVPLHEVEVLNRNIQPVLVLIGDLDELAFLSVHR